MTHVPHELAADFPELAEQIHVLKERDPHFARLMSDYHDVNRQVHRAETEVEPISPDAETDLRRRRMHLKDELYRLLTAA